jgi:hypothetical protein
MICEHPITLPVHLSLYYVRDAYLGVISVGLSCVEKRASQVLHLIKGIFVAVGIGEQEEQREKGEVGEELAKDGPHLNLFQSLLSCPSHFTLIESSCTLG